MKKVKIALSCCLFIALLLESFSGVAQSLEPRSLTNVPIGTNFGIISYAYSSGNVLLDPSLPIEDLNAKVNNILLGYARSINLFGKSGKIDAIIPYAFGEWTGQVSGMAGSTSRTGFGDIVTKLSINVIGGELLNRETFMAYNQKTFLGLSLRVSVPLGQYDPEKLINLGANRWSFRPQIGYGRKAGKWTFEGYLSIWLYTKNNKFFEGENKLTQDPFGTAKVHIIRSLNRKGMWCALDIGYGYGATTFVNGNMTDSRISGFRLGLTYALPLSTRYSLKFFAQSGIRLEQGGDYEVLGIALQYRF